jgi:hypothetical protein
MEFLKNLIREPGILFDDERIIGTGNQQDLIDTVLHQIAVGLVFGLIFKLIAVGV